MAGSRAFLKTTQRATGSVRWLLVLAALGLGASVWPAHAAKPAPQKKVAAAVHSRTAHHAAKPVRQVRAPARPRVQPAPPAAPATLGVSRNAKPRTPERAIPMDGAAPARPHQAPPRQAPPPHKAPARGAAKGKLPTGHAGRTAAHASAVQQGLATWYGPGLHNQATASGERFDMHGFTAAHPSLPFGTRLRVTHVRDQRTVVVRVNDRGPHRHGAILDLSYAAAHAIGLDRRGVGEVLLEVLEPGDTPVSQARPGRTPAPPTPAAANEQA